MKSQPETRARSRLRRDKLAQSPVIGVILMVAITVILAAVIATFVMGMGDSVSSTAPVASFDTQQENVTWADGTSPPDLNNSLAVNFTMENGEAIRGETIEITVNGNAAWDTSAPSLGTTGNPRDGEAKKPTAGIDDWSSGETVRVWLTGSEIDSGDRITISNPSGTSYGNIVNTDSSTNPRTLRDGDTVRIIWNPPNSEESSILKEYTVEK